MNELDKVRYMQREILAWTGVAVGVSAVAISIGFLSVMLYQYIREVGDHDQHRD